MQDEFKSDEDCIFLKEDYLFNVKWNVPELIKDRYLKCDILQWEQNDTWHFYAEINTNIYEKELQDN